MMTSVSGAMSKTSVTSAWACLVEGNDLVGRNDSRVYGDPIVKLSEGSIAGIPEGVEVGPNLHAKPSHLIQTGLVDLIRGQIGRGVVTNPRAIEIIPIGQLPDPIHGRGAWNLFIQLGHHRLICGDDSRIDRVPGLRQHSLSLCRADFGDGFNLGRECRVKGEVRRASRHDTPDLIGRPLEHLGRGEDSPSFTVFQITDQTVELVIHELETPDVVLGVPQRLHGVFIFEEPEQIVLPAEAMGDRVEVIHVFVFHSPAGEDPRVRVKTDLLLVGELRTIVGGQNHLDPSLEFEGLVDKRITDVVKLVVSDSQRLRQSERGHHLGASEENLLVRGVDELVERQTLQIVENLQDLPIRQRRTGGDRDEQ